MVHIEGLVINGKYSISVINVSLEFNEPVSNHAFSKEALSCSSKNY